MVVDSAQNHARCKSRSGLLLLLTIPLTLTTFAQTHQDSRLEMLRDADHFRLKAADLKDLASWKSRRASLRKKLAISAGLWPEPPKTPLHARVLDRRPGEGFSVARVHFESLPGFLVTGNLYFPEGVDGPFPAVLTPHGHWKYGRLQNGESGSIVARCIDFARMGFVTFSIDMVGYNDSFQLPHDHQKSLAQLKADSPLPYEPRSFHGEFDFPVARLHGLSLAGLQLWNGIRALDFLCSLPEVDCERIGVTGASGGATQTLLLMALDDRVKAAAPVNIIGAAKHPGCRCENMPGLWVDTSTLELAAVFAPRPLLLVSATEDPWTNQTPQREYPFLRRYYDLFDAPEMLSNIHIEGGHNYNAQSREAVYSWFCRHLQGPRPAIKNPPVVAVEAASLGDLRVFPEHILPEQAVSGWEVVSRWIEESKVTFEKNLPKTPEELGTFRTTMREMLGLVLSAEKPDSRKITSETLKEENRGEHVYRVEGIGRGEGDWFELESAGPGDRATAAAVLVYPQDGYPLLDESGSARLPWMDDFLQRGFQLYRIQGFASGALKIPQKTYDQFDWPDSYNRDNRLEGIQDTLTALTRIRSAHPAIPMTVIGLQRYGLSVLLAAAVFGGVEQIVIDLDGTDPTYDAELLKLMPVGSFARIGGFKSACLALSDSNIVLFNAGKGLDTEWLRKQANQLDFADKMHVAGDSVSFSREMIR